MSQSRRDRTANSPLETVFVGHRLAEIAGAIERRGLPLRVSSLHSISELAHAAQARDIACAVIDLASLEHAQQLLLPLLADRRLIGDLIVIGDTGDAAAAMPGVRQVLKPTVGPREILFAVSDALSGRNAASSPVDGAATPAPTPQDTTGRSDSDSVVTETPPSTVPGEAPAADDQQPVHTEDVAGSAPDAPAAGEAVASKPVPAHRHRGLHGLAEQVWRKFLPYANLAYKKLAIVILTSLFLLFANYGTTILFFLLTSRWSMPVELSRGHEMVVRADKDLGELRVRQNQVQQALEAARTELDLAERKKRDARLRLDMTKKTIDLELSQQNKMLLEIREHITRLKRIISDFRGADGNGSFARNLEKAYEARTITKKSLEAGTLSVLESLHRMALVHNDLALAELDETKIDTRVEFLKSLREQIDLPEIRTLLTAGADHAYLARDVIADQNVVAEADYIIARTAVEVSHLENSLDIVTTNIESILSTPIGRALSAPVTVVFVPYSNASDYGPGRTLYGCRLLIAFCSRVGETGQTVAGETSSIHPLFGKPLRGNFVEAILDDPESAKKELFHAVRPPLFF